MSSSATSSRKPRRVFAWFAKLGLFGSLAILLVALGLLVAVWGLGKTALLKYVVAEAVNFSDGKIEIEGVEGSIFGTVRIAHLKARPKGLKVPGPLIDMEGIALDWSLLSLLKREPYREPVIYSLVAKTLRVRLPYSTEPLILPASFGLPLGARIEMAQLDLLQLEVAREDPKAAPRMIEMRNISARAKYTPKSKSNGTAVDSIGIFEIDRIALDHDVFNLREAQLSIEDRGPFLVTAKGLARTKWVDALFERIKLQTDPTIRGDGHAKFDFRIQGPLLDLQIESKIDMLKTQLSGKTGFKFGQDFPLQTISLHADALDLQRLDVRAPLTQARVDWRFEPRLGIPGTLVFSNTIAGPFDAKKLPFSAGSIELSLDAPKLLLKQISVQLHSSAQDVGEKVTSGLTGNGYVDFSKRQTLGTLSLPDSDLNLVARDLDLSALFAPLMPTRLTGPVRIKSGEIDIDFKQDPIVATAALTSSKPVASVLQQLGAMTLKGKLRLQERQLVYEKLQVRVKQASLEASGSLTLDEVQLLETKGRAINFRPSEFAKIELEDARLTQVIRDAVFSGSFDLKGGLAALLGSDNKKDPSEKSAPTKAPRPTKPDFFAALVFEEGTRLDGRPVAGRLNLHWLGDRVTDVDAQLNSQGLRIKANGALGQQGDRLGFELEAEKLAVIDSRLRGALSMTGELRDTLRSPSIQAKLKAQALQFDGLGQIGSLQGQIDLPSLAEGNLLIKLEATQLKVADILLDRLSVDASGKASEHQFAVEGRGVGETVKASGKGSYFPQPVQGRRYSSQIDQAELSGRFKAKLESVMRLNLGDEGVSFENAYLRLGEGRLLIDRFSALKGEFASTGEARDLSLRQLLSLFEDFSQQGVLDVNRDAQRQADGLRLAAKWDLSGTNPKDLSGRASISLLEVDAPGALKLNLSSENTADIKFTKGQIDGRLDLVLPSIGFAKRYTGAQWDADGELRFIGRLQGTIDKPEYQGELIGRKLSLLQRSLGWRLSNGTLKARFDANGFKLEQLRVESGQGYVELSGEARILTGDEARKRAKGVPPLQGKFRLLASRIPVPLGPGQRLILSGDTQVLADAQALRWVGKLKADEGLIELRSSGVPDLPSDVVIVDSRKKPAAENANTSNAQEALAKSASTQLSALTQDSPLRLGADLEVDLGQNLRVVGAGVEARLEGLLSLKGVLPAAPRAVGIVNVRDGTYLAYGQKLEVTRGILRFQGELDNPALDLVAMRRFLPVEPGVQVTGTALSPRVKLTSIPEVSDAEKLSWLVLGTGFDDARSGAQSLALQQAALSLLGGEQGGLTTSIAKVVGLDVITLGTTRSAAPSEVIGRGLGPLGTNATQAVNNATVQQNVLTIGKRLSSRVFLSYEQGLRGVWNLLRIQYDISNRLSLRAQTGTENAIDLLLFRWFD